SYILAKVKYIVHNNHTTLKRITIDLLIAPDFSYKVLKRVSIIQYLPVGMDFHTFAESINSYVGNF
ncbi:MAG: hypothetical protein ACHQD8_03765, partial [Chitinophagales bacterium]